MALTRRNKIISRYNEQLEAAKEQYKAERGLKNAVGFKQSDDFRRLNKNKRNALYRERAKKREKDVIRLLRLLDPPAPVPMFSGEASVNGQLVNFDVSVIYDGDMFWTGLGQGGKVSAADNSIVDQFEVEHEVSPNTTKAVILFADGTAEAYTTPLQFERGMLKLIRQVAKEQKETGDSAGRLISGVRIELEYGLVIFAVYTEETETMTE